MKLKIQTKIHKIQIWKKEYIREYIRKRNTHQDYKNKS